MALRMTPHFYIVIIYLTSKTMYYEKENLKIKKGNDNIPKR